SHENRKHSTGDRRTCYHRADEPADDYHRQVCSPSVALIAKRSNARSANPNDTPRHDTSSLLTKLRARLPMQQAHVAGLRPTCEVQFPDVWELNLARDLVITRS